VSIERLREGEAEIVRLRVTLDGPRALLAMRSGLLVDAQLGKDRRWIGKQQP
jgi:hypothetical protein